MHVQEINLESKNNVEIKVFYRFRLPFTDWPKNIKEISNWSRKVRFFQPSSQGLFSSLQGYEEKRPWERGCGLPSSIESNIRKFNWDWHLRALRLFVVHWLWFARSSLNKNDLVYFCLLIIIATEIFSLTPICQIVFYEVHVQLSLGKLNSFGKPDRPHRFILNPLNVFNNHAKAL